MVRYHEEMVNAMKFFDYFQDQGNGVALGTIEKPEGTFAAALILHEAALERGRFSPGASTIRSQAKRA